MLYASTKGFGGELMELIFIIHIILCSVNEVVVKQGS